MAAGIEGEEEARAWIEQMLNIELDDDLQEALKSGVTLYTFFFLLFFLVSNE